MNLDRQSRDVLGSASVLQCVHIFIGLFDLFIFYFSFELEIFFFIMVRYQARIASSFFFSFFSSRMKSVPLMPVSFNFRKFTSLNFT